VPQTSRWNLRRIFCCAGVLTAIVVVGCNTCFVAFSNNGNGGVIIKAGNPLPACSVPQPMGKISVIARKAAECVSCTAGARIEHVFVTLQSIRIRLDTPDDADPAAWIELAPTFTKNPHQIDLADESSSDFLVKSAIVPAGTYRKLEMRVFSGQQEDALRLPAENACGDSRWNCIITGDGRIEALYGIVDSPKVVVPLEVVGGGELVILPNSSVDVQVNWVSQLILAPDAGGLRARNILAGTVEVRKQSSIEAESAASN
jgi:Domain of unknown function (DUF4382)